MCIICNYCPGPHLFKGKLTHVYRLRSDREEIADHKSEEKKQTIKEYQPVNKGNVLSDINNNVKQKCFDFSIGKELVYNIFVPFICDNTPLPFSRGYACQTNHSHLK